MNSLVNSKDGVKVFIIKVCREVIDDIIDKVTSTDDDDGMQEQRNKVNHLKSQQSGVWYQEESLGKGWRTCLISSNGGQNNTEKRMFYSPSGKLFYTREAAEHFIKGLPPPPTSNSASSFTSSFKLKTREKKDENKKDDTKNNKSKHGEAIVTKLESSDKINKNMKETEVSLDEISLEDISLDDLSLEEDFEEVEEPPLKKRRLSDNNNSKSIKLTKTQERILESCYHEWPHPTPEIVASILTDFGSNVTITKDDIEHWYRIKNIKTFNQIFIYCNAFPSK